MAKIDQEQLGELISAYIDGELDRRETEFVEHMLREDADARRLLDQLRQTVNVMSSLPRHAAPSGISEDVQLQLERSELLGDDSSADSVPGRRSPLFALLSMAATVCFVAVGWWAMNLGDDKTSTTGHDKVALATKKSIFSNVKSEASTRGGRSLPERSDESDPAAEDASSTSDDRLAFAATIDQKLQASGFAASVVKKHTFENETVRLNIPVRNAAERDRVVARLVGYLASGSAQDIGSSSSAALKRKTGAVGSFYYKGRPTVNFAKEGERQVLVRASRRELDGLMAELGTVTKRQDRVSLQAGPLTITGMKRAGVTLVHGLRDTPAVASKTEIRRQSKQDRVSETKGSSDALAELLKGIGLPPDLTTAHRKGSGSLARAKKSSSSRRRRTATRNKTNPSDAKEVDARVTSSQPGPGVGQAVTPKQPAIDRASTTRGTKVEANTPDEIITQWEAYDVVTPKQDAPTVMIADGGELVHPSPSAPRSLVGRRMDALTMAQRDKNREVVDDLSADTFDDAEGIEEKHIPKTSVDEDANTQEPYVTLVFRIVIESNRERAASRLRKPSKKARAEKPSGDPQME